MTQLDYCNSLYKGILHLSASEALAHEHLITFPHWLPLHFRIHLKLLLFAFEALNGLAPPHLFELLHPYKPSGSLGSADQLTVPKMKQKLRSDPPLDIRQASSLSVFKSLPYTHLFFMACEHQL